MQHPGSNKLQKCSRSRRPSMADRISELPEGILVNIVSLLTIEEAARTSILSHGWKKLWTFSPGSLNFDGSKVLEEIIFSRNYGLLEPERIKFVSWVNQILNAHKGVTIKELRVQFDLDLSYGSEPQTLIVDKNFSRLSISLSRIAKLKLDLAADMYGYFTRFPRFKNLEQLELIVKTSDHRSLLSCTSLLRACPMLYRFSIQMEWVDEPAEVRERVKRSIKLKCLKVVEFRWFRGSTTDVELATYLFTNAPYLEKIQVDTRHPYHVGIPFEVLDKENVTAKERVRQLGTSLSPCAELQLKNYAACFLIGCGGFFGKGGGD
ncbi:hypothetical protein LguiB_014873 [Lonicera macranthoides]